MNNIFFKNILLSILILGFSSCKVLTTKAEKKISPNYGNYCKFDQSLTNFKTIPVDKTDLACKNFHKCKKKSNSNSSYCNKELISKLEDNQKKSALEIKNCQKIIEFFQ